MIILFNLVVIELSLLPRNWYNSKFQITNYKYSQLPNLKFETSSDNQNVWVIGAWDLYIVCYLLFGAWNFLCSKRIYDLKPVRHI